MYHNTFRNPQYCFRKYMHPLRDTAALPSSGGQDRTSRPASYAESPPSIKDPIAATICLNIEGQQ